MSVECGPHRCPVALGKRDGSGSAAVSGSSRNRPAFRRQTRLETDTPIHQTERMAARLVVNGSRPESEDCFARDGIPRAPTKPLWIPKADNRQEVARGNSYLETVCPVSHPIANRYEVAPQLRGRLAGPGPGQHRLDVRVLVLILKQDVQLVHLRPRDPPLLLHTKRRRN